MGWIGIMAYRTFTDKNGAYWQVWDVRPERVERRSVERRNSPPGEWTGEERRKGDRRKLQQKLLVLEQGLTSGWLVFECKSEKRRLTPIPRGWDAYTESQLRLLCDRSQRVPNGANGHTSAA